MKKTSNSSFLENTVQFQKLIWLTNSTLIKGNMQTLWKIKKVNVSPKDIKSFSFFPCINIFAVGFYNVILSKYHKHFTLPLKIHSNHFNCLEVCLSTIIS